MVRSAQILVLVFVLSTAACVRLNRATPTPVNAPSNDSEQSLTWAGITRTYIVHLPPAFDKTKTYALVIVLHGGGGNADSAAKQTGFNALADKENFIVVYPNGTGRLGDLLLTWNSGNCCGYALDQKIDDMGFMRALIEKLSAPYNVEAKRIYATGISNGGMMAYRLACELSDRLAAIAPVSGALNIPDCNPAQPISVIAFHGTADENVLYNGGAPIKQFDTHPRVDQSVAYAMSFWSRRDGCNSTPTQNANGNIIRAEYSNCANGTGVTLYTIQGGGHAWPGGQQMAGFLDKPTQEISATELMWEFFKQHARP